MNDSDVDSGGLEVTWNTSPSHGTLILNTNGSFTYTPAANYSGTDSFTYKIIDNFLESNAATVNLTINPVNDRPVAVDDHYSTNEDVPLIVPASTGLLVNDYDLEGSPVVVSGFISTSHGTLSIPTNDGSFTYTPALNYHGTDQFSYLIYDGALTSLNFATVTITINAVNDAPVANEDSYTTTEDTALTINLPGVLSNDTDSNSTNLTAAKVTNPAHGTVTLNPNGSLTYTPTSNWNGADSFTYKASDGALDSNVATVTIAVTPVNDAPVAASDSYSTDRDISLNISAPGVLHNDSDIDSANLTAIQMSNPAHGTATLNANGSFSYTPATGYSGSDNFTYQANDGSLSSNVATISITVTGANRPPVAADDAFATDEDTSLTITAPGVLSTDSDSDGDALTAVKESNPSHGTLTFNANGSFTYHPAVNWNGTNSFTYKASDGLLPSNVAAVTITINPVNDAPIAVSNSYTTNAIHTAQCGRPGCAE